MTKITVIKKTGNFTILDNTCLKDENLSWKGRGLLVYLLHLPDDWQIYLEDLKNRGIDGRDSTISGIKELMKNGYIRRTRKRDKGRFVGYEYEVYEIPNELAIAEYAKSENGKSKVANSNLG